MTPSVEAASAALDMAVSAMVARVTYPFPDYRAAAGAV